MRRLAASWLAAAVLAATPVHAAPLAHVCMLVGASFESDQLLPDHGARNGQQPPAAVSPLSRGLAYALYASSGESGISWFSAATGGAPSADFQPQAEALLGLLREHPPECLVIGLTAEFFDRPERVGEQVAALVSAARARQIAPFVLAYPPFARLREPALHHVLQLTPAAAYEAMRARYAQAMAERGATMVPAWDQFVPGSDGLHPDYPSAQAAAAIVNRAVLAGPPPLAREHGSDGH